MKRLTSEWLAFAEQDFNSALRESQVTELPSPVSVCFHSHQAIEKLMKAVLVECGVVPEKTHDLEALSDRIRGQFGEAWQASSEELRPLQPAAVEFRYPGTFMSDQDAQRSFQLCQTLRTRLYDLLRTLESA